MLLVFRVVVAHTSTLVFCMATSFVSTVEWTHYSALLAWIGNGLVVRNCIGIFSSYIDPYKNTHDNVPDVVCDETCADSHKRSRHECCHSCFQRASTGCLWHWNVAFLIESWNPGVSRFALFSRAASRGLDILSLAVVRQTPNEHSSNSIMWSIHNAPHYPVDGVERLKMGRSTRWHATHTQIVHHHHHRQPNGFVCSEQVSVVRMYCHRIYGMKLHILAHVM